MQIRPMLKLIHPPSASRETVDDAALVQLALQGERAAMAEIYRRHAPRVRRTLARILGVSDELDDVLQQSFIAALRRLGSLRDPAALGAWLVQVGVGEARHHLRSKARRRWLLFFAPESMPEPSATRAASDAPLDEQAAVRATHDVLRLLGVEERIAFSLRYLDGQKLDDAAALCGVSLATFKRRLSRAETQFRARARAFPALDAFVDAGTAAIERGGAR